MTKSMFRLFLFAAALLFCTAVSAQTVTDIPLPAAAAQTKPAAAQTAKQSASAAAQAQAASHTIN